MIGTILGGIGLFLLGMSLLTDGLQAVAGDALRRGLMWSTRSRFSAVLTGTLATAAVQSSSATTLLMIGFVGAELITLSAALGLVFGANVGTTVTTWIVATVGLKLDVGAAALPLVGLGALARLVLRGRRAGWGSALAGFGLLFVGIGLLQEGMGTLARDVDLSRFAGNGLGPTLLLVMVGVVMTVVMQSSSAAVATTLAAVDSGAIGLGHAAALVVGQNVGTTITAGIGAIGGGAAVKRTALAHTTFNLGTGIVALGTLPLFFRIAGERLAQTEPAIAVSVFHSAFNLLGVMLFLPLIPRMARWLERVVPERSAQLTRRLAVGRAQVPDAVLEATRKTARDIAAALLAEAIALLQGARSELDVRRRDELHGALVRCRQALVQVRTDPRLPHQYREHVSILHALDHLARLLEAMTETERLETTRQGGPPATMAETVVPGFEQLVLWLPDDQGPPPRVEDLSREVAMARREARPTVIAAVARGELDGEHAEAQLEAMRWVDRLGYHTWRAIHHLERALIEDAPPPAPAPESGQRRGDETHAAA